MINPCTECDFCEQEDTWSAEKCGHPDHVSSVKGNAWKRCESMRDAKGACGPEGNLFFKKRSIVEKFFGLFKIKHKAYIENRTLKIIATWIVPPADTEGERKLQHEIYEIKTLASKALEEKK
jgi:hypothetical protein